MLMPPFELHHPTTVAEAVELAASLMEQNEAFDWVAGGTDVLPNYKWRINPKPHVISLAGIEEAHHLSATEIGCMVPLSSLTSASGVHPLLVEAAAKIASSFCFISEAASSTASATVVGWCSSNGGISIRHHPPCGVALF